MLILNQIFISDLKLQRNKTIPYLRYDDILTNDYLYRIED